MARSGDIGYSGSGLRVVYLTIRRVIFYFPLLVLILSFLIPILFLFFYFSSVVDHLYASNPRLFESHSTSSGLFFSSKYVKITSWTLFSSLHSFYCFGTSRYANLYLAQNGIVTRPMLGLETAGAHNARRYEDILGVSVSATVLHQVALDGVGGS